MKIQSKTFQPASSLFHRWREETGGAQLPGRHSCQHQRSYLCFTGCHWTQLAPKNDKMIFCDLQLEMSYFLQKICSLRNIYLIICTNSPLNKYAWSFSNSSITVKNKWSRKTTVFTCWLMKLTNQVIMLCPFFGWGGRGGAYPRMK